MMRQKLQNKQAKILQLQRYGDEKLFVLYEMFLDCQGLNGPGASRIIYASWETERNGAEGRPKQPKRLP